MPQIDPELKRQLLAAGKWREFVKYREDLKLGGMLNSDAHHKAVAKFIENPPTGGWKSPQHKARIRTRKPRNPIEAKKARKLEKFEESVTSSPPDVADVLVGAGGLVVPTGPLAPLIPLKPEPSLKSYTGDWPELPEVCSEDFEGKRASEVESVRWVADNMEIVNPQPGDCPSAAAWGLFVQCRGSVTAKSDFWKLTFPKLLPSRAQMDAEQDSAPDESKAKEVIEDLLRFGKAAQGEAVVGSEALEADVEADQEPATLPEAVEPAEAVEEVRASPPVIPGEF